MCSLTLLSTRNRPPRKKNCFLRPIIRRRSFYTLHARKHVSQSLCSSLGCHHPGTVKPWWTVTHMLVVTTFKLRHPVRFLILVKADDLSLKPIHSILRPQTFSDQRLRTSPRERFHRGPRASPQKKQSAERSGPDRASFRRSRFPPSWIKNQQPR
jgi:hypothetical protein